MKAFSNKLHAKTFIVIGDLMVDAYDMGTVSRISPEAPIPVLDFKNRICVPGGAANVAMNLVGLGNQVELVGLIGDDATGQWLKDYLNKHGVGTKGILSSASRPTTNKVRFATIQQSMLRVDYEDSRPVEDSLTNEMTAYIEQYLQSNQVNGVLVSDYNKGLITYENKSNPFISLFKKIVKLPLLCGADTKKSGTDLSIFSQFDFIKPNLLELEKAVNMKISLTNTLQLACQKFLETSQAKTVLVTLCAEGLYHFNGVLGIHVPTVTANVCDVTGAGDTVFAVVMQSLLNGLSWVDSMRLANMAASVIIESQGTKAISIPELYRRVELIENTQPNYFIS
ncbi:bifunctional heptose 7-phosphate kinase/heptose 1-phosphate adenyltransferase [Marinisporobacter balticus]|uniref:RfaE bifunctional protein kinase chain/domain n=1 Tax=Marinisporobacter balticus TaxID=2018667 RepID=A0A4R2L4Y8_9FIRM|nr:bifunctional ADP-heptose synthase [Marinisporobacter balticus]TCO79049.1 rfaE bifunctional protein kinase chain/domain [Marinisporobacter balticus]